MLTRRQVLSAGAARAGSLALGFAWKVFAPGKIKVWFLVLVFLLTGAVLAIGTSPERMAALGIYKKQRVLGTEAMFEAVVASRQESRFKALISPFAYFGN